MSKIIAAYLGNVIPIETCVYEDDLARTERDWDQNSFENGSWVEVFPMGNRLYAADSTHRLYVAFFQKGLLFAPVTLAEEKDYQHPDNEFRGLTEWQAYEIINRKNMLENMQEGVLKLSDLENRIKPGDWRTAAREEMIALFND